MFFNGNIIPGVANHIIAPLRMQYQSCHHVIISLSTGGRLAQPIFPDYVTTIRAAYLNHCKQARHSYCILYHSDLAKDYFSRDIRYTAVAMGGEFITACSPLINEF